MRRCTVFASALGLSGAMALASFDSAAQAQGPAPASGPAPSSAPRVEAPVVLTHVDAVYPPSALERRRHADVVLTVTIDVDGHVSKVDVVESGGADLDEAAVIAARQWTFTPATRNGEPVASRIKMPFHFAPPEPAPELVEVPRGPGDVEVHEAVQTTPASETVPPASALASASASAPTTPPEPQEVLVSGRSRPPSRGPSDFDIPLGELNAVPRKSAGDFLKLAPGILVTNEGGEGHAESVMLRGFDAGEGESMELSVDGVPINEPGNFHGNGYADTHFIIPELIESVRVLEGPFNPHQGNFAVAGSADYGLGLAERGLTAKYTGGSYGAERLVLLWGPQGAGAHTFGAAAYAQSDGYGANRAYRSGSAIGQYEGKFGAASLWRVTAQAYSAVSQAAGVVREDDYEAGRIGFYGSYDPNQGQDSSRFSLAADLESRAGDVTFAQSLFLLDRASRIREDFTGYAGDAGVEDPRGTGLDLVTSERTLGARGSAREHVAALGQHQDFEVGYEARGDAVDNVQHLLARDTQVPYATDANLSGNLADVALYADASLRPLSWVTARGGVRGELFTYDVEDRCPAATDYPCDENPKPTGNPRTSAAKSAILPRASLLLGPAAGFTFVGSYGQGVRSLGIDEISAGADAELARISSYEGGVSYVHAVPAGVLTMRSVFYATSINADTVFDPTVGRTVDTGATTRTGWVGAGRFTGSFLDLAANVAAVRGTVDASHEPIPYVPHVMARADAAVFGDLPWTLASRRLRASIGPAITYVGPRSLPYGETSVPYALLDAAAKLTCRPFELSLEATNVFDARYRSSEFTFASEFHSQAQPTLAPARVFTAGAPRMVFLSLSVTLGG